jgi:hypothetical protein
VSVEINRRYGKTKIAAARALLKKLPPLKGEERTIYACGDCGQLFGHRYVPYGLGRGVTINECLCQLTAHRPMKMVLSSKP